MPKASSRADVSATRLCVLGIAILVMGIEARAQDSFDSVELPAPAVKGEEALTPYDQAIRKTELEVAKQHVRSLPLNRVNASIKPPAGDIPQPVVLDDDGTSQQPPNSGLIMDSQFWERQSRPWAYTSYQWEAPASRHLPLLFEEPNLERLGYAYGFCDVGICEEEPRRGQRLQALVSGFNFFARIPFIPYMAGVRPLTEPVYTLGADRPGSPVPYRKYYPHWSLRGAAYQSAAAVAAVFIIP